MSNLAEECDRFSISDRSAAYLSNALLKDIGNISEYNQKNIIKAKKDGKRDDTIAQISGKENRVEENILH